MAKVLPLVIVGDGATRDEAMSSFKSELATAFALTTGYRYWRVSPTVRLDRDVENHEESWIVRARLLIVDEEMAGLLQAVECEPWPEPQEPPEVAYFSANHGGLP